MIILHCIIFSALKIGEGISLSVYLFQDLSFFILVGNSMKVSPGAVARFLTHHKLLLTLECDNMRAVSYHMTLRLKYSSHWFQVLVCLGAMGLAGTYQSNLRKMVLESCREDTERLLEEVIDCFPLLEALSFNNSDLNLILLSPVSRPEGNILQSYGIKIRLERFIKSCGLSTKTIHWVEVHI